MDYEGTFQSSDGLEFYKRGWLPEGDARANVVLIHGYGEHCSRYAHAGAAFKRAGFGVHTYDQRGYGHSPGRRAYVERFDTLLEDLDTYMAHVEPLLDGKPWFLMGHSMGGLIVASYAETRTIAARGLIFSSPFLAFNDDVPAILFPLAKLLGTVAPWLPVSGVDNQYLSRDPEVVKAADVDPLAYHGKVVARTGAQFNMAITRAREHFGAIALPSLILHGSADKVVPAAGSRLLHERCGARDKTLRIFEGGYHELWNDLCKEEFLALVCEWILQRIP